MVAAGSRRDPGPGQPVAPALAGGALAEWTALRFPVRGSLARAADEFLKTSAFLVEMSAREAGRVNSALRAAESLATQAGLR